ncbi:MAG: DUF418 domain-containing protein [Bacteroidota bacterium]
MQDKSLRPVTGAGRILSLDVLRGVAVLGILIMNIQSFSMPSAAYINPTAYGDLTGFNKWIWILSHLLASEKFMSLFSMLFGAGVVLFSENAESKGYNSATLHYRRMGWLLLFGLIHAYFFWYGDILVNYSLCGMLIFLFRKKQALSLIWMGFGFFMVPLILDNLFAWSIPYWPEEAIESTLHSWSPDSESLAHELEAMRGAWQDRMGIRVPATIFMQTGYFMMGSFWRVMSMMLLGMALFKWKILSALRPDSFYFRMVAVGLVTGYAISGLGLVLNFRDGWSMEFSMFTGSQFNYLGSLGVALGYAGAVMLLCKRDGFNRFKKLFASVGRMAFTNYILMTLICVFLFNGAGLALFGTVERGMQVLIMIGIWILLLLISSHWMKHFRFGPLEALWRRMTYWRAWKL